MFGAHVDLAANGGAALALGGTEVEPLTLDLAERDLEQVHRLDFVEVFLHDRDHAVDVMSAGGPLKYFANAAAVDRGRPPAADRAPNAGSHPMPDPLGAGRCSPAAVTEFRRMRSVGLCVALVHRCWWGLGLRSRCA